MLVLIDMCTGREFFLIPSVLTAKGPSTNMAINTGSYDVKCTFNRSCKKIPAMQFFTGIFRHTQSASYMLSLTDCVLEFQNNALRDNIH